jgi:hypothetical protein
VGRAGAAHPKQMIADRVHLLSHAQHWLHCITRLG